MLTLNQRIAVSINCALFNCALLQYSDPIFVKWANAWIDGTDRTAETAWAAAAAAADFNLLEIIQNVLVSFKG